MRSATFFPSTQPPPSLGGFEPGGGSLARSLTACRKPEVAPVHATAHAHAPSIGEIRQDAQAEHAVRELGGDRPDRFGDRVDEIRAHRVLAVHVDVHDEAPLTEIAHLDFARPAAARDQVRYRRARNGEQPRRFVEQPAHGERGVRDVDELHLPGHERIDHFRDEPAARAGHARGVRRCGDDARLLDDHGRQAIVTVHAHVERDAERQAVRSEHVLDELVGARGVEPASLERGNERREVDARALRRERAPLVDRQPIKAGNTRTVGHASTR